MTEIHEAIRRVDGEVGVMARHLDTGREFRHNERTVFFTASTLKVPLLVALYRQIDRGNISPEERVKLADASRVPGSGVLKELGNGLRPTIHDLAMLMIIISDNTATDILYERVGQEALHETIRDLGLSQTRIPMTCRQLLFSITGLDPQNPEHTFETASGRLFHNRVIPESDGYSEEKSDVSSPADMCRLLETLYAGEALSPASREAALDILMRQQLRTVIPADLPAGVRVAHKTGSYTGVRCDVGIVFSPAGAYTVALMGKRMRGSRASIDAGMAAVSRAIYDTFVEA